MFFVFKQKTAYEMRISDWSSDVCSSDLGLLVRRHRPLDADLAAQRLPVKEQRDVRVRRQLAALAAVEIGVEDETVGAMPLEQHHAQRRVLVGRRRRKRHRDRKSTRLNSSH